MKLTKGKKLIVLFGGVCLESEAETPEEDRFKVSEFEDVAEAVVKHRTEMIKGLNRSKEVKDVSDLYSELPEGLIFNPIVFKTHIPLSLQKPYYVRDKAIRAQVENFEVVYSTDFLMISALCDLDKYPFGAFDVRDQIDKIFEPFGKIRKIPPCLSPVSVAFQMPSDSGTDTSANFVISVRKSTQSKTLLRKLHKMVEYRLPDFYEACYINQNIFDEGREIEQSEYQLLKNLGEFLVADWRKMRKKRRLINQSKREMAGLLEKISSYNSMRNLLILKRKNLNRSLACDDDSFCTKLIKEIGVEYLDPHSIVDISSVIRNIEHIRNEMETYSSTISTLMSALIGGMIGSVITYVLSTL